MAPSLRLYAREHAVAGLLLRERARERNTRVPERG